jgi:hypothetical protein
VPKKIENEEERKELLEKLRLKFYEETVRRVK